VLLYLVYVVRHLPPVLSARQRVVDFWAEVTEYDVERLR
jgi:hypothetical protein